MQKHLITAINDQHVAQDSGGSPGTEEVNGLGYFLRRGETAQGSTLARFGEALFTLGKRLPCVCQDGAG